MQKGSGNGALLMRKRIVFVIINRKKYDDINILVINKHKQKFVPEPVQSQF